LNSIENSVLKTASQNTQAAQAAKPAVQAAVEAKAAAPVQSAPSPVEAAPAEPAPAPQAEAPKPEAPLQSAPSFDTMDTVPETSETNVEESFEGEEDIDAPEDDNHDGLGFDIF